MTLKIMRSRRMFAAVAAALLLGITASVSRLDIFAQAFAESGTTNMVSRQVIGDLGGMLVRIPAEFARFVEYDEDPHFLDKAFPLPRAHTYQSKLRSFGFEVRFPDMKGGAPSTPEERDIFKTMWMRVGVNTGSNYGDGGDILARAVASIHHKPQRKYDYVQLKEGIHGLTVYTPVGVDLSRRDMTKNRPDLRDEDIFFSRDPAGNYEAFIECTNVNHSAVRCQHIFRISKDIKANISVNYRRDLLPHWREIQNSISKVILGFRTKP